LEPTKFDCRKTCDIDLIPTLVETPVKKESCDEIAEIELYIDGPSVLEGRLYPYNKFLYAVIDLNLPKTSKLVLADGPDRNGRCSMSQLTDSPNNTNSTAGY
jgi:hypothetical protein